jgi:hypothetical protein
MKRFLFAMIFAIAMLSACEKAKPPKPKADAGSEIQPVKNVESLPSGTIQEGARTMNRAADLGKSMEQQKQDREKDAETQNK